MKNYLICAIFLFSFLSFGCEKDDLSPVKEREITDTQNQPDECNTEAWDLSCFAAGETRAFSIDVPAGTTARWAITENENEFEFDGDNTGPTVMIKALSSGMAKLNVAVASEDFVCASCKDICF